jgi:hypothetical protein
MKNIAFIVMALLSSHVFAEGDRHGGDHGYDRHYERHYERTYYVAPVAPTVYYTPNYYPGYYKPPVIVQTYPSTTDILLPMIVGAAIGYAVADTKTGTNSTPVTHQTSVKPNEPIYQYQTIHDAGCDCDKRVLVRVD